MASKAERIVAGLGGADNIVEIEPCITRLRTEVTDGSLVDEAALKDAVRARGLEGRLVDQRPVGHLGAQPGDARFYLHDVVGTAQTGDDALRLAGHRTPSGSFQ